jgi:uncharacterized protein YcaQ
MAKLQFFSVLAKKEIGFFVLPFTFRTFVGKLQWKGDRI